MTVATSTSKSGPYAGAGTTGPFTVTFRFLENSHLQVIKTSTAGIDSTLALTTDYAVSGAGASTGTVTLVSALLSGEKLTIIRNVPFTQEADYVQNDAFPAESHERALDKLTMETQQLKEATDRSIKLPATSTEDVAALTADLIRVADSADNIDTVADNIDDITTVANDLNEPVSEINTVAGAIANVNAVGSNITNVNTVAGISANVTTVAAIDDDVTTVAGVAANVTTVAGVSAAVTAVAAIDDDVTIAAANVADITNFADVYQGPKTSDPTTRNDGNALQAGDLYFNTTTNRLRVFGGSTWQEGNAGSITVQRFSGTGAQTAFTLSTAPQAEENTQIYIGGVYQQKDRYIVSGTTLTFSTAPPSGTDNIEVVVISVLPLGTTDASLTNYTPAGSGAVTTTVQAKLRKTVSPEDVGSAEASLLLLISGPADAHNYCANPVINQIAGGKANVIAGGGYATSDNEILGATDYQTISGGYDNTINGCIASTIGGGAHHNMLTGVTHGTIGGGSYNDIESGDYGTIAGGTGNTLLSSESTIAGGTTNTVGASSTASSIGGGSQNSITSGLRGTISGGIQNQITGGSNGAIGGGQGNVLSGGNSFAAGQTNTVSGLYSFAFGLSNTVSAPYAAAWGRSNTASKDYGSAHGYQAVSRSTGRTVAGGQIAAAGDAQYTDLAIKGTTTSNTNVFLTGADNNQFVIPFPSDNFAATVTALLTAVEPATGASKSFRVDALVKRIGGVNTLVSVTTTVIAADASATAWTVTAFSLSTNNMRIGVAGDAGKTIRWAGKVTAVEVSF